MKVTEENMKVTARGREGRGEGDGEGEGQWLRVSGRGSVAEGQWLSASSVTKVHRRVLLCLYLGGLLFSEHQICV
jgi:hypothetical protein